MNTQSTTSAPGFAKGKKLKVFCICTTKPQDVLWQKIKNNKYGFICFMKIDGKKTISLQGEISLNQKREKGQKYWIAKIFDNWGNTKEDAKIVFEK